ncbi:hypothetical protein ACN27G_06160 [Plantactinospora sp. WMMB334]|uniref:hypothetical protein n=1 Tax=Plantactinospora sp. WMMB334 TaxID=3404119 RepID=UPI003B925F2C
MELTALQAVLLALPVLVSTAVAVLGVAVYLGRIRPPAAWTPGPDDVAPAGGPTYDDVWAPYYRAEGSGSHV